MNFLQGNRYLKDVVIRELNRGSGIINFPDHSNERGVDVNRVTPLLEAHSLGIVFVSLWRAYCSLIRPAGLHWVKGEVCSAAR
jgi:hypothetical protein